MITSTSGMILNHGVERGYRWVSIGESEYALHSPEFQDNKGRVLLFIIGNTVEFIDIVYSPYADLLLGGQGNIVDLNNLTVGIGSGESYETIVFEESDEDHYAILVSNPIIIEQTPDCTNNCLSVQTPGWLWDGEKFYQ